jgi:pyruvate formate lyase activating enzyme
MNIGGFITNSFIDYPARICSVVFVAGCNFHCPYCHNPELLSPAPQDLFSSKEILSLLAERASFLDGVVISGGEPTLDRGLPSFLAHLKEMGYAIKLDTNGSRPHILKKLLEQNLVDYLAMDIKTNPVAYPSSLTHSLTPDTIPRSIDIVMHAGIDYEFRTTCVAPFISTAVVKTILPFVAGARCYILQRCRHTTMLNPSFFGDAAPACTESCMRECRDLLAGSVEKCLLR